MKSGTDKQTEPTIVSRMSVLDPLSPAHPAAFQLVSFSSCPLSSPFLTQQILL